MENQKNEKDILGVIPEEFHEELYQKLKGKFEKEEKSELLSKATKTFVDEKNNSNIQLGGRKL